MPSRSPSPVVRLRPKREINLAAYLERRQRQLDRAIDQVLPATQQPNDLVAVMRYGMFPGGKRIRPILMIAAAEAVGSTATTVLPFACALEMIHAYSLIHDDLPAMDDDDMRRGLPSCHVRFGEALAILAGDALLTEAFGVMAEAAAKRPDPRRAAQVIREVADAAGRRGMVGGQVADMAAEKNPIDLPSVEMIHIRKTGALIRAAVRSGAVLGGASADQLRQLTRYADAIGLAFQIADDVLDAEGSAKSTGNVSVATSSVTRRHSRRFSVYPLRRIGPASCCRGPCAPCAASIIEPRRCARSRASSSGAPAHENAPGRFSLMGAKAERADRLLVERGLVGSRERARRLILAGEVWSNDQRIAKASDLLAADAPLEVRGADIPFVSRGGLKLDAALEHWKIEVAGSVAVDVGASTGGFTDSAATRRHARLRHRRRLRSVRVGTAAGSTRHTLRTHQRTSLRSPARLGTEADIVVADASFISLKLILPMMNAMLRPGGILLPLVKPQFEVGKGQVGKGGVVRSEELREAAVTAIRSFGETIGLISEGTFASPVEGPKGNREFFVFFRKASS